MEIHELLNLGNERQVNKAIVALLKSIVEQHREEKS
jgi:hypothetical protein